MRALREPPRHRAGADTETPSRRRRGGDLIISTQVKPDFEKTDDPPQPKPDFQSLIALFYPSVTGIMAGCNRSGVLAQPSRSIPIGTLSAILCTTSLYLLVVWVFGSVLSHETLLDNPYVTADVAWPHPVVVKVGIIMSSLGAALQS